MRPENRFESFESKMKNRRIKDLQEQLKFANSNIASLTETLDALLKKKAPNSIDENLLIAGQKPIKVSYHVPVLSADYNR
jgi:hypothetical protein